MYHVPPYPRPYMDAWKVQRSVAHRWPGVGRMLGCRILLHFHPFGQRILIFGRMTARRCARCSLGVFQLLWPACYEGRPNVLQAVQCNGVIASISLNELLCSVFVTLESHFEDSWSRRHVGSFPLSGLCKFRWLFSKVHLQIACFPVTSRSPYTVYSSFFLQDYICCLVTGNQCHLHGIQVLIRVTKDPNGMIPS